MSPWAIYSVQPQPRNRGIPSNRELSMTGVRNALLYMARNFLQPKKKTVRILAYINLNYFFFYIPFSNAILCLTQIVPQVVLSAGSCEASVVTLC